MSTVAVLHAAAADIPLLTGGTIARLADAGHRVVIVTLTGDAPTEVASMLGAARVESLGYELAVADESKVPIDAVDELVDLLEDEPEIDLVISYNAIGIAHEPTHMRVHEFGNVLSQAREVPTVEAAVPRELVNRGVQLAKTMRKTVPFDGQQLAAFPAKDALDYAVPTKKVFDRKWDAMQRAGGGADDFSRMLSKALALPRMMVAPMLQTEYFGLGRGDAPAFFTSLVK